MGLRLGDAARLRAVGIGALIDDILTPPYSKSQFADSASQSTPSVFCLPPVPQQSQGQRPLVVESMVYFMHFVRFGSFFPKIRGRNANIGIIFAVEDYIPQHIVEEKVKKTSKIPIIHKINIINRKKQGSLELNA